jgi:hypothetical protein
MSPAAGGPLTASRARTATTAPASMGFRRSAGWDQPRIDQRPTPQPGDPLFAVWAHRSRLR